MYPQTMTVNKFDDLAYVEAQYRNRVTAFGAGQGDFLTDLYLPQVWI
jgi:hypothetical protein